MHRKMPKKPKKSKTNHYSIEYRHYDDAEYQDPEILVDIVSTTNMKKIQTILPTLVNKLRRKALVKKREPLTIKKILKLWFNTPFMRDLYEKLGEVEFLLLEKQRQTKTSSRINTGRTDGGGSATKNIKLSIKLFAKYISTNMRLASFGSSRTKYYEVFIGLAGLPPSLKNLCSEREYSYVISLISNLNLLEKDDFEGTDSWKELWSIQSWVRSFSEKLTKHAVDLVLLKNMDITIDDLVLRFSNSKEIKNDGLLPVRHGDTKEGLNCNVMMDNLFQFHLGIAIQEVGQPILSCVTTLIDSARQVRTSSDTSTKHTTGTWYGDRAYTGPFFTYKNWQAPISYFGTLKRPPFIDPSETKRINTRSQKILKGVSTNTLDKIIPQNAVATVRVAEITNTECANDEIIYFREGIKGKTVTLVNCTGEKMGHLWSIESGSSISWEKFDEKRTLIRPSIDKKMVLNKFKEIENGRFSQITGMQSESKEWFFCRDKFVTGRKSQVIMKLGHMVMTLGSQPFDKNDPSVIEFINETSNDFKILTKSFGVKHNNNYLERGNGNQTTVDTSSSNSTTTITFSSTATSSSTISSKMKSNRKSTEPELIYCWYATGEAPYKPIISIYEYKKLPNKQLKATARWDKFEDLGVKGNSKIIGTIMTSFGIKKQKGCGTLELKAKLIFDELYKANNNEQLDLHSLILTKNYKHPPSNRSFPRNNISDPSTTSSMGTGGGASMNELKTPSNNSTTNYSPASSFNNISDPSTTTSSMGTGGGASMNQINGLSIRNCSMDKLVLHKYSKQCLYLKPFTPSEKQSRNACTVGLMNEKNIIANLIYFFDVVLKGKFGKVIAIKSIGLIQSHHVPGAGCDVDGIALVTIGDDAILEPIILEMKTKESLELQEYHNNMVKKFGKFSRIQLTEDDTKSISLLVTQIPHEADRWQVLHNLFVTVMNKIWFIFAMDGAIIRIIQITVNPVILQRYGRYLKAFIEKYLYFLPLELDPLHEKPVDLYAIFPRDDEIKGFYNDYAESQLSVVMKLKVSHALYKKIKEHGAFTLVKYVKPYGIIKWNKSMFTIDTYTKGANSVTPPTGGKTAPSVRIVEQIKSPQSYNALLSYKLNCAFELGIHNSCKTVSEFRDKINHITTHATFLYEASEVFDVTCLGEENVIVEPEDDNLSNVSPAKNNIMQLMNKRNDFFENGACFRLNITNVSNHGSFCIPCIPDDHSSTSTSNDKTRSKTKSTTTTRKQQRFKCVVCCAKCNRSSAKVKLSLQHGPHNTTHICNVCLVPLCRSKSRNCWSKWHSDEYSGNGIVYGCAARANRELGTKFDVDRLNDLQFYYYNYLNNHGGNEEGMILNENKNVQLNSEQTPSSPSSASTAAMQLLGLVVNTAKTNEEKTAAQSEKESTLINEYKRQNKDLKIQYERLQKQLLMYQNKVKFMCTELIGYSPESLDISTTTTSTSSSSTRCDSFILSPEPAGTTSSITTTRSGIHAVTPISRMESPIGLSFTQQMSFSDLSFNTTSNLDIDNEDHTDGAGGSSTHFSTLGSTVGPKVHFNSLLFDPVSDKAMISIDRSNTNYPEIKANKSMKRARIDEEDSKLNSATKPAKKSKKEEIIDLTNDDSILQYSDITYVGSSTLTNTNDNYDVELSIYYTCTADRFSTLDNYQIGRIYATFKGDPKEILFTKYSVDFIRENLFCLKPVPTTGLYNSRLYYANDEVINMYFNLLQDRDKEIWESHNFRPSWFCNTFFYTRLFVNEGFAYKNVKRWTKKIDIFGLQYMIIPLNIENNHWILLVIVFQNKIISIYDSLTGEPGFYEEIWNCFLNYLDCEFNSRKQPLKFNRSEWKLEVKECAKQRNGCDCGIFTMMYADFISTGSPLEFTQEDMPLFRNRIAYSILSQRLLM